MASPPPQHSPQQYMADYLAHSLAAMQAFAADPAGHATMHAMTEAIVDSLRQGGKLLVAGNGGSAGDAQHIACEFVTRLMHDRAPLAAMALTVDSSVITSTGNDYGFSHVFERQVRALGRPGDVLLAISTSGRSPNIVAALQAARAGGLRTLGFAGRDPAAMGTLCDILLCASTQWTPVVQQVHITAGHIICALVERAMFPPA